jgi:transketolase N-terminal domain/subunit
MGFNMRYLDLKRKIRDARMWAIQGITEAGSGHPGASFSAAETGASAIISLIQRRIRHPAFTRHLQLQATFSLKSSEHFASLVRAFKGTQ